MKGVKNIFRYLSHRAKKKVSGGRTVPTKRLFKENAPFISFILMGSFARTLFFLEHFCLDQFSVIQGKFYTQDSRTHRLVEHFWVPILGASCSNKLFLGTLRPAQSQKMSKIFFDNFCGAQIFRPLLGGSGYSLKRCSGWVTFELLSRLIFSGFWAFGLS